jgi:CAAX protease family protein
VSSPHNPIVEPTAPTVAEPVVQPIALPPQTAENPAWTGWDVLRIFLLGIAGIFASAAILLFAAHGSTLQQRSEHLAARPELLLLAQMVVYAGLLAYMYVLVVYERDQPRFWQAIGWNFPGKFWPYIIGGICMQIAFLLVARFLPFPEETPFQELLRKPLSLAIIGVFSVSFGPLMEELFFRGFLYPVIVRRVEILARRFNDGSTARNAGIYTGIFVSAITFALIHGSQYAYSWASLLLIGIVGVVLGTVRALRGSVGAAFVVHASYNSAIMILVGLATGGFRHLDILTR